MSYYNIHNFPNIRPVSPPSASQPCKEESVLNTSQRRAEILELLRRAAAPIPAKDLAARFHVSRQVIVQDLAVIRASTPGILSTNRGYILEQQNGFRREFKVRHGADRVEQELNLFVDGGGCVKNVSISHRVYGRISAELEISSRQDVQDFVEATRTSKSTLLGSATSGYHYHLVEAASEARLDRIEEKLRQAGLLADRLPWELGEDK